MAVFGEAAVDDDVGAAEPEGDFGEEDVQVAADAATASRSFGYDASGNMTSAATSDTAPSSGTSNATSESFTYDDRGQVLTASGTAGSTSYTYNGDGLVTSVADAAGTTSYTYDSADRLSTLSDPATGTTATYTYNSDSLVTGISYGSGNDSRVLSYDGLRRLTSDTLETSSGTTVASVSYGYDPNGNLTSMDTTGLAGPSSNTCAYDEAGRLTSWDNGTTVTDYAYDGSGNLTQDGSKTYTYDARDELASDGTTSYGYTADGTPASQTTGGATVSSTSDAFGQEVTAGTQTYTHDALGRMTADASGSGGTSYAFSYAGVPGTIASDGASTYTWGPSGSTLAGIGAPASGGGSTGSGVLAFTDVHGDVAGQFAASGSAMTGSAGYGPWGTVTGTAGVTAGLLGFQSGWTDPVTGKVAMGARWYSPSSGGFISADTVAMPAVPDPAMANPFAYVGDGPLTGTDPTGHWCLLSRAAHWAAHTIDSGRSEAEHLASAGWHAVTSAGDAVRHDAGWLAERSWRGMLWLGQKSRNLTVKVYDGAKKGVRTVGGAIGSTARAGWDHASSMYQTAVSYGTRGYQWAVHTAGTAASPVIGFVKRTAGKAVKLSRAVIKSGERAGAATAGWVAGQVKGAGQFLYKNAAAIGGMGGRVRGVRRL